MFCAAIYKRSPESYEFIAEIMLWPSSSTLKRQLNEIPLTTGCNKVMTKFLKLLSQEIVPEDRTCILLWDEMSIQPSLRYDKKTDILIGFEDWGKRRTHQFADHAIVFYITCLASGNNMPLGYGYCHGTTTSTHLSLCIKEWLTTLIECGFNPVATVCDQGGSNIKAIESLIEKTRSVRLKKNPVLQYHKNVISDNTFCVKGHKIIPLYDYVHLQKCIRNNLLTKDLAFLSAEDNRKKYASWDAVATVYEIDKFMDGRRIGDRHLQKLNDKHIYADLIPRMKVKYAVQTISHKVASTLELFYLLQKDEFNTAHGKRCLHESTLATSEIILFFDRLFDSFNGEDSGDMKKEINRIITDKSSHVLFWRKAIRKLQNTEYVQKTSHEPIKKNPPKCIRNWIWTIRGALALWQQLQKSNFSKLDLHNLNQNRLENFFSRIRDIGHRNNNPSPTDFAAAFKTLLITNITSKHSFSANCKESCRGQSMSLMNMYRATEVTSEDAEHLLVFTDNEQYEKEVQCTDVIRHADNIDININAAKVISKLQTVIKCTQCVNDISNTNFSGEVQKSICILEQLIPYVCYHTKIMQKCSNILRKKLKMAMHCPSVLNVVFNTITEMFLIQWCTYVNDVLHGTIKEAGRNVILCQAEKCASRFSKNKKK